ncbi:AMP-binding protein [Litorivicinus lipolyticus]|uniref:AMP-binding protein n=1 Tax=Litorivicinus lipolyticus TaxID=418701 RepID=A0A5Q2QDE9_9GAMM|nr:propionyl-CoA synthetase [Litorivicinus lipolyticus]QGG80027.1 AMP-binding protein [Litorivicinus lipolyticus]
MYYAPLHDRSVNDPEAYWMEQAESLAWAKKPTQALGKDANGSDRWFVDGELNTCYLAVDVHVENGRGAQAAIIYDSPVTGTKRTITYAQLQADVAQLAGALRAQGVGRGDRVVIYMPMVYEAVLGMLASARLGAVHSVVFGGFAASELTTRIDDAQPKVLLTATCGIEPSRVIEYMPIVNDALGMASHQVDRVLVLAREQAGYAIDGVTQLDWAQACAAAEPADCVNVLATDPLYILYTSGTTGKPKGVVRDNGGHAVAMRHSMDVVYDVQPGDVFWAASDVGWVVGHSYIVYAPLLTGCTTLVYEGKPVRTPDAGAFWRVVEEYRVKILFAAPTAFRAIRKEDPEGALYRDYDLSSLAALYLAGERLDPPTQTWLDELTGLPVIDHWWQTETGWAIAANPRGVETLPIKQGSATRPAPGFDVHILDDDGVELSAGEQGNIVIKRPLPPSCFPTVWGDHARYQSSYMDAFPGYYQSGDGGYIDADGYLFVMGRTDDVINVAGHRLSTGEMEEVVAAHPAVAECAVIGVEDALKGQLPVGLVILKDGVTESDDEVVQALVRDVRAKIGPIACFQTAHIVARLPKTRSGKILRAILRKIANGQDYQVPSTIEDPAALTEVAELFN